MTTVVVALSSALWLGILTSISRCPLATNVAAVSFIVRRWQNPADSLVSGILYSIGRMSAYTVIGMMSVWGVLNIPLVSQFMQEYSGKILGPILIIVGMILVDLISFNFSGTSRLARLEEKAVKWGHTGSFVLGVVFALAFCPVSAALFFGALIPAAIANDSAFAMPAIYGLGTGLPVLFFAVFFAAGIRKIGGIVRHISTVEIWSRRVTGLVFIIVGLYYSLTRIFNM